MRKFFATILSTLILALCMLCGGGYFGAQKSLTVSAAAKSNACTAVSKDCAAVSYDDTLYLYYEHSGVWQTYVHSCAITTVEFDGEGNVYFLDEELSLYDLHVPTFIDTETTPATPLGITDCSVFCIEKNTIYYAKNAILYKAPLHSLNEREQIYDAGVTRLFIDVSQNDLYLVSQVFGSYSVHKLPISSPSSPTLITVLTEPITSFTVVEGRFYATTANGKFFHSPLNDFSKPTEFKGNYAALSSYENAIYLSNGSSINAYSKTNGLTAATGAFAYTRPDQIPTQPIQAELNKNTINFTVVQTEENALLIEVDLNADADVFPCLGTTRNASITALQIAQTEKFSVLSYQKTGATEYSTFLVAKSKVSERENWESVYDTPKTGYLTNQAQIMKLPRLGMANFDVTAQRDEKITILGEIHGLERAYYKVQKGYTVGYLPKSYINDALEEAPTAETVIYGEKQEDGDSIFQLTFILLGCALIGILADFLIIRHIKTNYDKKRGE